jgi:hypothetical protein
LEQNIIGPYEPYGLTGVLGAQSNGSASGGS